MNQPLGRMRDDLVVVTLNKGGRRSYRVSIPNGSLQFEFHDLELQAAKAMDGLRTADEVSAHLRQQGLSLSADHIQKFYRELVGMGFVGAASSAPVLPPAAGGDHREDASLFVSEGNAALARGEGEKARGLFEAALELDNASPDAEQGLARCDELAMQAGVTTQPDQGKGASPWRWELLRTVLSTLVPTAVLLGFFAHRGMTVVPPPPPDPAPAVAPDASTPAVPAPPPPPPVVLRALVPVQRAVHPVVQEVRAPVGGKIRRIWPARGAWVKAGDKLMTVGTKAVLAQAPGVLEATVRRGKKVEPQQMLGVLHNPATWSVTGSTPEVHGPGTWSCVLAGGAEQQAPCTLRELRWHDQTTMVEVTVAAADAPWLEGPALGTITLTLGPAPDAPP